VRSPTRWATTAASWSGCSTSSRSAGWSSVVAIPTTAGTGSEVGRSSVITLDATKRKAVVFHPELLADLVILDPELTLGLPPKLTAATGADALARATSRDVLLVASVLPYTRLTVELAEYAVEQGMAVVAITDSEVAPLAQIAQHAVIVATDSPSFFHAMSPAFVVAEILGAIIAGRGGDDALAALRHTDEHLAALNTHLKPRANKKTS